MQTQWPSRLETRTKTCALRILHWRNFEKNIVAGRSSAQAPTPSNAIQRHPTPLCDKRSVPVDRGPEHRYYAIPQILISHVPNLENIGHMFECISVKLPASSGSQEYFVEDCYRQLRLPTPAEVLHFRFTEVARNSVKLDPCTKSAKTLQCPGAKTCTLKLLRMIAPSVASLISVLYQQARTFLMTGTQTCINQVSGHGCKRIHAFKASISYIFAVVLWAEQILSLCKHLDFDLARTEFGRFCKCSMFD